MAEQKDRERSRDHRSRDLGAPPLQRSARPPAATAADIDRVLRAISGLSDQIQAIGDRTAATEIRLDELAADLGDMREVQEAQAQTVPSVCSRTDKVEAKLAEAPQFEDLGNIVVRLRALEERPQHSSSEWPRASQASTRSGPTTPPSGARTPVPPKRNPYEADATIVRLVADKPVPRDAVESRVAEFVREAGLADRKLQVRGAFLGQRHLLRVTGTDESADAKTLVQSLRLADNTWKTPLITTPDGESVGIHLYSDRPQAERARRGEAMRALRIIQAEGIPDAVAHGRDGLVARGWTPLAKVEFDAATSKTRTVLYAEAVRAAGADPGVIQRRLDDEEDRPRPGDSHGEDPQATPGAQGPAPTPQSAEADAKEPQPAPSQPPLAQADEDMGESPMAQPVS